MASKFTELVVDCADPERVARFWSQVLDYPISERGDGWAEVGGEGGTPRLFFVTVPESKTVKNRLHIDLNPSDRDQVD